MGGGALPEIPTYTEYNNVSYPKVEQYKANLSKLGLQDPWLRNHIWKLHPKIQPQLGKWHAFKNSLGKGFWAGLGLAAGIIAVEESYSYYYYGHTSWNPPEHH